MNPLPIQVPILPLDPATFAVLLFSIRDAMPQRKGTSEADKIAQRDAALAMLAVLRPRDPIEATLVTRIIITNLHAVDSFASAAESEVPVGLQLRHRARATALIRLQVAALRELDRTRADEALRAARLPAQAQRAQTAPATGPTAPQPTPASEPEGAAAGQPPGSAASAEGRHERRRRERAERHLAAAAQSAGLATAAREHAMQQRLRAETAAPAATSITALAA